MLLRFIKKTPNIYFIEYRKYFFIFSLFLALISIASLLFKGLNFGIDFKGGLLLETKFKNDVDLESIRNVVVDIKVGDFTLQELDKSKDNFLLKIPLLGKIVVTSNVSTLVKTLSVMLKSGVHLLQAVQISAKVIPNTVVRNSISSVASRLRQGEKLSHALAQSEYLPKLVIKMLAVGEETGNVEDMMERVGSRYDADLRAKIKNLLNLFEPVVIVCLGGIIAFIVVTMFLAISDITKM